MTAPAALDRVDERLSDSSGARGLVRSSVRSIRDGDLGFLPVVVGLVIIAVIFQILNPVFLSSVNLVNLTLDSAAVGVISLGIVFVLLVGRDRPVGRARSAASPPRSPRSSSSARACPWGWRCSPRSWWRPPSGCSTGSC